MNKLFTALLLLVSVTVLAAPTGTLNLSGTVAAINSLVVTPNGTNNTTLNIATGVTNLNVASVQETSNDPLGYKITLQSSNAGFLQLSTNAAIKTAYQVSYNGAAAITPTATAQVVKSVASLTQQTTATSAVTVTSSPLANPLAGTYSDTLTIAIVAN